MSYALLYEIFILLFISATAQEFLSATGHTYECSWPNIPSWEHASAVCSGALPTSTTQRFGFLASTEIAAEHHLLAAQLFQQIFFTLSFIGAHDSQLQGAWRWQHSGCQFSQGSSTIGHLFAEWRINRPNNVTGQPHLALTRSSGTWDLEDQYFTGHSAMCCCEYVDEYPFVYFQPLDRYYEIVTTPMNWTQATADAESRSYRGKRGHLATIETREEYDFILANIFTDYAIHVGAERLQTEFLWLSGAAVNTSYFVRETPSASDTVLHMFCAGEFDFSDGSALLPFIIEYEESVSSAEESIQTSVRQEQFGTVSSKSAGSTSRAQSTGVSASPSTFPASSARITSDKFSKQSTNSAGSEGLSKSTSFSIFSSQSLSNSVDVADVSEEDRLTAFVVWQSDIDLLEPIELLQLQLLPSATLHFNGGTVQASSCELAGDAIIDVSLYEEGTSLLSCERVWGNFSNILFVNGDDCVEYSLENEEEPQKDYVGVLRSTSLCEENAQYCLTMPLLWTNLLH